ncbi:hypothetical protein AALB39_23680 [Lachnospiraceae bacterium 54-53]
MNKKRHSGVFLMEMAAVILFFILCAAVCIQTFVKADSISRKAADLNQGVLIAQSVAEVWKAEGAEGFEKRFQAGSPGAGGEYEMGFGMDGRPTGMEQAVYDVKAEISLPGKLQVTVSRGEEEVFSLEADRQEGSD